MPSSLPAVPTPTPIYIPVVPVPVAAPTVQVVPAPVRRSARSGGPSARLAASGDITRLSAAAKAVAESKAAGDRLREPRVRTCSSSRGRDRTHQTRSQSRMPSSRPASPSRIPAPTAGAALPPRVPTITEDELALFLGSLTPDALAMMSNVCPDDHAIWS